jgi:hypothetical protein
MSGFTINYFHKRIDRTPFSIGNSSVKALFNIPIMTVTMVPPGEDIADESKVS